MAMTYSKGSNSSRRARHGLSPAVKRTITVGVVVCIAAVGLVLIAWVVGQTLSDMVTGLR
jgi:hypothetical protein